MNAVTITNVAEYNKKHVDWDKFFSMIATIGSSMNSQKDRFALVMKTDRTVPLRKLEALKTYDDSKIVGDLMYLITQGSEERLHKELIKALTYELSTRECASQYPELLV
jgi:hypothetical protein